MIEVTVKTICLLQILTLPFTVGELLNSSCFTRVCVYGHMQHCRMCEHLCIPIVVGVQACRGQRLTLGVFLCRCPVYLLRPALSLNLEMTDLARAASPQVPWILCPNSDFLQASGVPDSLLCLLSVYFTD